MDVLKKEVGMDEKIWEESGEIANSLSHKLYSILKETREEHKELYVACGKADMYTAIIDIISRHCILDVRDKDCPINETLSKIRKDIIYYSVSGHHERDSRFEELKNDRGDDSGKDENEVISNPK